MSGDPVGGGLEAWFRRWRWFRKAQVFLAVREKRFGVGIAFFGGIAIGVVPSIIDALVSLSWIGIAAFVLVFLASGGLTVFLWYRLQDHQTGVVVNLFPNADVSRIGGAQRAAQARHDGVPPVVVDRMSEGLPWREAVRLTFDDLVAKLEAQARKPEDADLALYCLAPRRTATPSPSASCCGTCDRARSWSCTTPGPRTRAGSTASG